MKLLIQRVREASVEVGGEITGRVDHGFLVFVGVAEEDTTEIADKMIDKMVKLRIFEDENGKTNKSIADVVETFSWYPSLLCMRTAARETAHPLQMRAIHSWQTSCTNMCLRACGTGDSKWVPVCLVRI